MKELNWFVKDNMSKWNREQLSIAHIIQQFMLMLQREFVDVNYFPEEMIVKPFIQKIMDGIAVEISKEKFEEMKQKYIAISKLAKNGTEK